MQAESKVGVRGRVTVEVLDRHGRLKQKVVTHNLVTNSGDAVLAGIVAGGADTLHGMSLGTGTTAAAKGDTALQTAVASSYQPQDATFPQAITDGSVNRRVRSKATWAAGDVTANNIAEVGLWTAGTDGGSASGTLIARAILGTTVNKASGDSLAITWDIDLTGA